MQCSTLPGDLNQDGKVDMSDVITALRLGLAIIAPPNSCGISSGDVNCNSRMDVGDAVLTLKSVTNNTPLNACPAP